MQEEENNNRLEENSGSKRRLIPAYEGLRALVKKEKKARKESKVDLMVELQKEFEILICHKGFWPNLLPPVVTIEKLGPITRMAKEARELSQFNRSTWLIEHLWTYRNYWHGWFQILEDLDLTEPSLLSLEAR